MGESNGVLNDEAYNHRAASDTINDSHVITSKDHVICDKESVQDKWMQIAELLMKQVMIIWTFYPSFITLF